MKVKKERDRDRGEKERERERVGREMGRGEKTIQKFYIRLFTLNKFGKISCRYQYP